MRLEELERTVQAHVLAGGALPDALERAVQPPAVGRWEIYSAGYRLRLVEALAAQYPALAARLGAAAFAERMRAFVEATPSLHRSVRDYGAEVGAFLAAQAASDEDAMLAELAQFEWQLAAAFDAPDAVALAPADLAEVAAQEWPSLSFAPLPSVRRLQLTSNAVAAWRAATAQAGTTQAATTQAATTQAATAQAATAQAAITAAPADSGVTAEQAAAPAGANTSAEVPATAQAPVAVRLDPVDWLIWRPQLTTQFRSCEPDEAVAFDTLAGGASFGELCGLLLESHGDQAALQAAGWLKRWLTEGLLLHR